MEALKYYRCVAFLVGCASVVSPGAAEVGDPFTAYDGQKLLRVTACTEEQVELILDVIGDPENGGCTLLYEEGSVQLPNNGGCSEGFAICPAKIASVLVDAGLAVVEAQDAGMSMKQAGGGIEKFVPNGAQRSTFYNSWRDLSDREARVRSIVENSNGVAILEELSPPTVEGRRIAAVRLRGEGWSSETGGRVVVTCQVHAREWIAGMACIYFLEQITERAKADRNFLRRLEFVIVPMANPDGFQYSTDQYRFWRKNTRALSGSNCKGVDLNRNWDKDWNGGQSTSRNPCSDVFVGSSPRSEPESEALASVFNEAPMSVHIDVHSYGCYILGPWGYTSVPHPRKREIDLVGTAMQSAIRNVHGQTYEYGTGGDVLYLASGVITDYTTDLGALSYTFELRPQGSRGYQGFNPDPSTIVPTAQETLQGVYSAIASAKNMLEPMPEPSQAPSPAPTQAPTGMPVADSRLAAYWDLGRCNPAGNNHQWSWCGEGGFNCARRVSVSTSVCPSGAAVLASTQEFVKRGDCVYAYYAQYQCELADSKPSTTPRVLLL